MNKRIGVFRLRSADPEQESIERDFLSGLELESDIAVEQFTQDEVRRKAETRATRAARRQIEH